MKSALKAGLALAALGLVASPAMAGVPGTGEPEVVPPSYDGSQNPGTTHRPTGTGGGPATPAPASKRAIGKACAAQGASKSNANDPDPGTPFSRCVTTLAKSTKAACADEPKQRAEGDTESGTPYSRCVSALTKGLRASSNSSASRQAKIACNRPDFETGREFSHCVRVIARALRKV